MIVSGKITRAWSLYIEHHGRLVVCVSTDGTPVFGPGVTAENVWLKIAEAIPTGAVVDKTP